jgi:hypothetical protein
MQLQSDDRKRQADAEAASRFGALGYTVAVDRPCRGTIVPATFYRRRPRVWSLMIEVNRSLLLDGSGERAGPRFEAVTTDVRSVLVALAGAAADHSRDGAAVSERECIGGRVNAGRREAPKSLVAKMRNGGALHGRDALPAR